MRNKYHNNVTYTDDPVPWGKGTSDNTLVIDNHACSQSSLRRRSTWKTGNDIHTVVSRSYCIILRNCG